MLWILLVVYLVWFLNHKEEPPFGVGVQDKDGNWKEI